MVPGVSSPFILYVNTTAYDLRKVSSWSDTNPESTNPTVQVRFIDMPEKAVEFDAATFIPAMQAALDASV